ncbi:MAG TPA: response regulator transcription factor, partial [Bacteroidia bacterium]|nr:response regulator transcription factor [Bacteroidia bacterium]
MYKLLIAAHIEREFADIGTRLKNSFGFDVHFLQSDKEIIQYIGREIVDVIIIDLEIQGTDGILLCSEIKNMENAHIPFIIIGSERTEDYVQTAAFDSGADSFLLKPLKPRLIAAHIKAMLKRKKNHPSQQEENQKKLIISSERHMVIVDRKEIELPLKEFALLNLLYSNPTKIFTRADLAEEIWKDARVGLRERRTIDVHISNLRNKIGGNYIRTISGI